MNIAPALRVENEAKHKQVAAQLLRLAIWCQVKIPTGEASLVVYVGGFTGSNQSEADAIAQIKKIGKFAAILHKNSTTS